MSAPETSQRLESIDVLRGVVMVLMALDHVRDFFMPMNQLPENVPGVGPALFATRFVTHFCAPVFVFLAGTGAYLLGQKMEPAALTRFLWTRGLWIVLLEITLVDMGWLTWFPLITLVIFQVFWAIGVALVVLAMIHRLPWKAVLGLGAIIVLGHNLLDRLPIETAIAELGNAQPTLGQVAWMFVHADGAFRVGPSYLYVAYPALPWIGVLLLGWCFGRVMLGEPAARARTCFRLGLGATAAFILLRALDVYGDPRPWSAADGMVAGIISFLNTEKYPPSLLYTLMTLGPALLALSALERWGVGPLRVLLTFGRVPLFYYLLHLPVINLLAATWFFLRHDTFRWIRGMFQPLPESFEPSLVIVYVAWVVIVLLLWPACRWFEGVKQRRREWWIRYL
ncbi:MAG: heparan-alpha-glucosaminide N-acetyltransferase domain-containing protein [Acidobacteriota bacterium]